MNYFKRICKSVFNFLLDKLLPNFAKRTILLSSLVGCIMDIPKSIDVIDDKEVISLVNKLNNLFHLSKSTVGLASPMIIHHLVWHDLFKETLIFTRTKLEITSLADLSKHKLNTVEKRIVANKVLDSIPKWLRYNSRNKMRADLITLFDNVDDFVAA